MTLTTLMTNTRKPQLVFDILGFAKTGRHWRRRETGPHPGIAHLAQARVTLAGAGRSVLWEAGAPASEMLNHPICQDLTQKKVVITIWGTDALAQGLQMRVTFC
jgi:hypothetical protein